MSKPWWSRARATRTRAQPSIDTSPRLIRPKGQAISGRAYYVWDEDPQTASDWARELHELEPPTPLRPGLANESEEAD